MLDHGNDGAAKRPIVDVVGRVTREGGTDYVPPSPRIATFDSDGITIVSMKKDWRTVFVQGRKL